MKHKHTPDNIVRLEPNQVFVFGSNDAGVHGAGAARVALKAFGAEWGVGEGPTGQCYAIPTKDHRIMTLPLDAVAVSVKRFLIHAAKNPEQEFLVTKIGCGLAGFLETEIAPLFKGHGTNVILPRSFAEIIGIRELARDDRLEAVHA